MRYVQLWSSQVYFCGNHHFTVIHSKSTCILGFTIQNYATENTKFCDTVAFTYECQRIYTYNKKKDKRYKAYIVPKATRRCPLKHNFRIQETLGSKTEKSQHCTQEVKSVLLLLLGTLASELLKYNSHPPISFMMSKHVLRKSNNYPKSLLYYFRGQENKISKQFYSLHLSIGYIYELLYQFVNVSQMKYPSISFINI